MAVPPYAVPSPPLLAVLRSFFGSDLAIWATITYAPSIMLRIMGVPRHIQARLSGQEREWLRTVMRSFLPVKHRVAGIINDVCVSNPAMNHVDSLIGVSVPVLVVHAVDDPMPPFATARDIAGRLPNGRFVAIQDGGHLLLGHRHEVRAEIASFVARYALI